MIREAKEVVRYRYLLGNLVRLHLRRRHQRMALGFAWPILQPLLLLGVLLAVFGGVGRFHERIPRYPLFLLCGLVAWQFTSASLLAAAPSFRRAEGLLLKVPFPRQIVPLAAVAAAFLDFLCALAVLGLFLSLGRVAPGPSLLALPLLVGLHLALAAGLGLLAAVATAHRPDLLPLLTVALRAGFYLSPIAYPAHFVPVRFRALFLLNPVAHLLEAYRAILLDGTWPARGTLLAVAAAAIAAAAAGGWVHRRYADRIVEVL